MDQSSVSFIQKTRYLDCAVPQHSTHSEYNNLTAICLYPQCNQPQKACCYLCNSFHKDHKEFQIPIEEVQLVLKDIYDNGLIENKRFQAFKTEILRLLKIIENNITQQEQHNPLKELITIYDNESFDHTNINKISNIIGKQFQQSEQLKQSTGIKSLFNPVLKWANLQQKLNFKWEYQSPKFQKEIDSKYELIRINMQKISDDIASHIKENQIIKGGFSQQIKSNQILVKGSENQIARCVKTDQSIVDRFWCASEKPLPNTYRTRYVIHYLSMILSRDSKSLMLERKSTQQPLELHRSVNQRRKSFNEIYFYHLFIIIRFTFSTSLTNSFENRGLHVMFGNGKAYSESRSLVKTNLTFVSGDILQCQFDPLQKVAV